MPDETQTILRRGLLLVLLVGIAGSSADLLLLEHYEEWRQFVPLAANALALTVLAWYGLGGAGRSIRALQIVMAGFEIGEISCPAAYFEEASSINFRRSVTYGLGVIKTSFQALLHRTGLASIHIFRPGGRRLALEADALETTTSEQSAHSGS